MLFKLVIIILAVVVIAVLVWKLAPNTNRTETEMSFKLYFDTTGWELRESSDTREVWIDNDGDALTLNRMKRPADLPVDDLKTLRIRCRELAKANEGGLVSADVIDLQGLSVVTLIYKREELPSYAYTGMMVIPGNGEYFIIVVASVERGTTGVRDALVTAELLEQGKLDPTKTDDQGRLEGWIYDPYDSEYDEGALNSVADDERYDSLVPFHPLSKVRRTLRAIADSLHWSE